MARRPTFGANLISFLEANGLSQAELARRGGVNAGTVTRWKDEEQVPDYLDFLRIARVLKVDPYLLAGSSFQEPKAPQPVRGVGRPAKIRKVPLTEFEEALERGPESPALLLPAPVTIGRDSEITPKKPS